MQQAAVGDKARTASLRMASEVRILDPAYRDQEPEAWRTGRFAERVRREWNPVRTSTIKAAATLGELADAIHKVVGGERDHILDRLELFADAEGETL